MWTITHESSIKAFDDLALAGLTRQLVSQAPDIVRFTQAADIDSTPLWAYGDSVTIYRDAVQWFVGTVLSIDHVGQGNAERISYTLAGPWHDLDRLVFQQTWRSWISGFITDVQSTHVILGQRTDEDGNVLSMASDAQLAEVIAWAQTCGSSIAGAGGYPSIAFPADEVRDITCAEAIRKVLRWIPDAVTWFDYTTSPPTMHVARRSALSELNLPIDGGAVASVDLTPRYDLQRDHVYLRYEVTTTIDGQTYLSQSVDPYPAGSTGRELGALVATIDLTGPQASWMRATTTAIAIDAEHGTTTDDSLRLAWWKLRHPWLKDSRITTLTIDEVVVEGANLTLLPNELVDGQVADWMVADEVSIVAAKATIRAKARFRIVVGDSDEYTDKEEILDARVIATNAPIGPYNYSSLESFESGDPMPDGLAHALYDALNPLQYSGSVMLHESDVGETMLEAGILGSAGVGLCINLTGGLSEWASMRAVVQQVVEDIDRGITTMSIGPAEHLGPSDLVELLRVNRYRSRWTMPRARTDPSISLSSQVEFARQTPIDAGASGAELLRRLQMLHGDLRAIVDLTSGTGEIKLEDTAEGGASVWIKLSDAGGLALQIREYPICIDGEQKYMLAIGSEPYSDPITE